MSIYLRDYRPSDLREVARVIRDSYNNLRTSRGGRHPDDRLDKWLEKDDAAVVGFLVRDARVVVACDDESQEIVGVGAYTDRLLDRLLGSAYVKGLYVREAYQRGRHGARVGTMIRDERIRRIRGRGFRKIYAFSVPESRGFHEAAGAVFYPEYDAEYLDSVPVAYFEIILRESPLNSIRIEPRLHRASRALSFLLMRLRRLLGLPEPEL